MLMLLTRPEEPLKNRQLIETVQFQCVNYNAFLPVIQPLFCKMLHFGGVGKKAAAFLSGLAKRV